MTTLQKPEAPAKTETLAAICARYDVAKLVQTTFDHEYIVYYRADRPYASMSRYIQLEWELAALTGQPADLIPAGAPCLNWPEYQKAVKDGTILYQL